MTSSPSSGVRIAALALAAAAIGVAAAFVVAGRGERPAPAERSAAAPAPHAAPSPSIAASLVPAAAPDAAATTAAAAEAPVADAAPKKAARKRRADGEKDGEPPQAFVPLPIDPETAEAQEKERAVAVAFAAADRAARELSLSFDEAARLREVLARIEDRRVSVTSKLDYAGADPETIAAEAKEFGAWARQEITNEFGADLGQKIANHARLAHVGYDDKGAPHAASSGKGAKKEQRVSKQKKPKKQKQDE